jgi:2-polyprenyl-6-hydroxyphenyl methylase / 3-demethylubiquinone-9 3-methyltransferase
MSTNVDPSELRKFGNLAHRWWDPESSMRPLHELNPLRLDWIDALAPLSGMDVLDVGCGGGILTESMALRGARVTGIDLADKSLQIAELHALESGARVNYRKIAAEDLASEAPGRFDIVTCMELLEHVPDPAQTVHACATLVRPGGTVFFSTINRNAKSFLFAIVAAEHVMRLLPRGTHEYQKFVRPSELAAHARAARLEILELRGMTFNPFSRRFALGADTDVNYLMACRRP